MSTNRHRDKRVAEQLGMPEGTAAHRLRKIILFDAISRLNENFCFQCGAEIETVDELSIEHKTPWENISADLFWCLDNIAFSHRSCNRPHIQNGPKGYLRRKCDDLTTHWCWGCQACLSVESFTKSVASRSGLDALCKECRRRKRNKK